MNGPASEEKAGASASTPNWLRRYIQKYRRALKFNRERFLID